MFKIGLFFESSDYNGSKHIGGDNLKIDKLRNEVAKIKEENNFTNREIGILCDGLSCSTISRLLTGEKTSMTKKTLKKFMKLFDLNESQIEAITLKETESETKEYEVLKIEDLVTHKKYIVTIIKGKQVSKVEIN